MTSVYYNEIDPYCAKWLANLMDAGLIPRGDIDTRSIEDVIPNELRGYTQCHFFAGLGGWAYALELAGWGTRPVWTGSCPCQPFSAAGKGDGFADERHLWPAFQHLIAQCRPSVVFGEQVASKDADAWIDLVQADMEGMVYAFGCVPFPAASVRAPHIRDRSYWVAHADYARLEGWQGTAERSVECAARSSGLVGGMADADNNGRSAGQWHDPSAGYWHPVAAARDNDRPQQTGPLDGFWRDADWLLCTDGKWRPVEPGAQPLAYGLPKGMGSLPPELRRLAKMAGLDAASLNRAKEHRITSLRGYGNAIVAPQAAEFVTAYMQARGLIADDISEAA